LLNRLKNNKQFPKPSLASERGGTHCLWFGFYMGSPWEVSMNKKQDSKVSRRIALANYTDNRDHYLNQPIVIPNLTEDEVNNCDASDYEKLTKSINSTEQKNLKLEMLYQDKFSDSLASYGVSIDKDGKLNDDLRLWKSLALSLAEKVYHNGFQILTESEAQKKKGGRPKIWTNARYCQIYADVKSIMLNQNIKKQREACDILIKQEPWKSLRIVNSNFLAQKYSQSKKHSVVKFVLNHIDRIGITQESDIIEEFTRINKVINGQV